ncbi:MAG TPA: hypothetical protein VLX59_06865 [Acidimicrobiales bacterium]|nr:hypothetical protein [Acidimicrobiales bacterium]
MRRISLLAGLVVALSGVALVAGCSSSGPRTISAHDLATKIIPAPSGFAVDPTQGASGQLTPDLFSQYGGVGSASTAGFVAGFKQNYVNDGTEEGIAVTVLEFSSKAKASDYFKATAYKTLSFAAPTYSPVQKLAGAVEASGTRTYDGNYVHGVADATGRFYFQVVYENPNTATVPVEFPIWADAQWELLQPGVSLPSPPTTNA